MVAARRGASGEGISGRLRSSEADRLPWASIGGVARLGDHIAVGLLVEAAPVRILGCFSNDLLPPSTFWATRI